MTRQLLPALIVALWCSTAVAGTVPAKSPVPVPWSLRTRYDRLADQNTVEMRSTFVFKDKGRMSGYDNVQISAFFISQRDSVAAPDSVTVLIVHGVKVRRGVAIEQADWAFAESASHGLRMLSDDVRHDLGSMRYLRGPLATGYLEEHLLMGPPNFSDTAEILVVTLKADLVRDLFGATSTEGLVDGFRFLMHNSTGGNDKLYREFAGFLRDLASTAR